MLGSVLLAALFVGDDGISDLVGDADASGSGAEYNHVEVFQLLLADVETGHDGREGDAAGALYIVVEAGDLGPVVFQDATGWNTLVKIQEGFRCNLPLDRPKSSKWMYALGNNFRAAVTKLSTNSSYFSPRTRFCLSPR